MDVVPDARPPSSLAMAERTLRLIVSSPTDKYPRGIGSGLLIKVGDRSRVVSAGHVLLNGAKWAFELAYVTPVNTLCVPVYDPRPHGVSAEEVCCTDRDIAWADVDFQTLQRDLEKKGIADCVSFDVKFYLGRLDAVPTGEGSYSFCSMSRVEAHPEGRFIVREPAVEDRMRYIGVDQASGLYAFQLAEGHAGHAYYKGSSGSPIVAADGTVVSLVVSGDDARGIVYGVPLAKYAKTLLDQGTA